MLRPLVQAQMPLSLPRPQSDTKRPNCGDVVHYGVVPLLVVWAHIYGHGD
jgi:hypothetical protein